MLFHPTEIPGVVLLEPERSEDDRGWFARAWCSRELAEHGLNPDLAQASLSHNERKGTLRGMHYQAAPHEEAKVVRVVRGAVYDVALDLRRDSPTFRRWVSAELSEDNGKALFIPEGVAHGFQTLEDQTTLLYFISTHYVSDAARTVRWDDPAFGIEWPAGDRRMSDADRKAKGFDLA
jgi:dTDP-4-dehydrorhamnose 3,5-epimerase